MVIGGLRFSERVRNEDEGFMRTVFGSCDAVDGGSVSVWRWRGYVCRSES